jgi:hypothetical protein
MASSFSVMKLQMNAWTEQQQLHSGIAARYYSDQLPETEV